MGVEHLLDEAEGGLRECGEESGWEMAAPVVAEGLDEVGDGHAPGFVDGLRVAGHGGVGEVRGAVEVVEAGGAGQADDEDFATPGCAVGAIAGAVEGNAEDASGEMILGHAAGDVGVVMLDSDEVGVVLRAGPLRGEIAGVEIVGDGGGVDFEDLLEVVDGLLEEVVGGEVFEVADVLAQEGVGASGEADGVLELASDGEDRRDGFAELDGGGNEASRATNELRAGGEVLNDRVVAAEEDVAIVEEEEVGNGGEAGEGFAVVDGDGLFAEIGAGHDEGGEAGVGEEQVVERGVGEEEAEVIGVGREVVEGGGALGEEDDGALDGFERGDVFGREETEFAGCGGVADHDGEGLFAAGLAEAKFADGVGLMGVDCEVEAAEAFDRDDGTLVEEADGFGEGIAGVRGVGAVDEGELGAAVPAGVGLGVEAAVERVVVLGLTGGAHAEGGHGGLGSVVGDAAHDGETRAAVGAVDEGVEVAAVGGMEELGDAVGTGGDVGRDEGVGGAGAGALQDEEAGLFAEMQEGGANLVQLSERRSFGGQSSEEGVDVGGRPLDFDGDSGFGVEDAARKMEALGEAVDVGAKAYSLHDATDFDLHTLVHCSGACEVVHELYCERAGVAEEVMVYA